MNIFNGFGLTVTLFALSCGRCAARPPGSGDRCGSPDTIVVADGVTARIWRHPQMIVVEVPDTMRFFYRPRNATPLDALAAGESLRVVINASFFKGVRGDAAHAGWLSMYGRRIAPLEDDRQLTHVVRINGSDRRVDFLPAHSFVGSEDPRVVEFQTGPLVIDGGNVREDLIRGSINGSARHARTLLATLDRRRCFFITVPQRVTLKELAATMLGLEVFRAGRLDAVNLDGGSSVALCVGGIPLANVNTHDRLPLLLGFR